MQISDLKRSFYQFKKHQEVGYLNLKIWHKIILSMLFFILSPTVIFSIFLKKKKKKKSKEIFVLEYTNTQPYKTIYSELKKVNKFTFIQMKKKFIPMLPFIFYVDIGNILRKEPLFFLRNLYFFGALALKISKYNTFIQQNSIENLVVFQEYSFYSSYLTRILEKKGGSLYNIQHGIPGDTYCFFRFSKCFVWGEYYKQTYIKNGAEPSQFVVAGSIFHNSLDLVENNYKEDINVLYVMQGYVGGKEETLEILDMLEKFSEKYKVKILQHPRHKIVVNNTIESFPGEIIEAILRSRIIISHYSTALLDAQYLNKYTLSYIGSHDKLERYVTYLNKEQIIKGLDILYMKLDAALEAKQSTYLDIKYIDKNKNPIKFILDEYSKADIVED